MLKTNLYTIERKDLVDAVKMLLVSKGKDVREIKMKGEECFCGMQFECNERE
jgi:hypothetical protein